MPTYVYECKTCQKRSEIEQRITEDAFKQLPCDCVPGEPQPVRRLIQPVGIAFKGGGFHINDYASTSSGSPSAASTTTEAAPAAAPVAAEPAPSAQSGP